MLYYDIETAPQLHYAWGSGKYDTRPLKVVKPRYHLSVTYGWEPGWGEEMETHFIGLNQNPAFKPDHPHSKMRFNIDQWVIGALWHLFDMADITIAHNGKKFDTKRTNARLIAGRSGPYSPVTQIDTLLEYRKQAAFASNRLDDLAFELGLEGKYHHPGLDMWWGCMEGDAAMWAEMETYNHQDVRVLRQVHHAILPWTSVSLNAAAWATSDAPTSCPQPGCGGTNMRFRKNYPSPAGLTYKYYQCGRCGKYSKTRYADPYAVKPFVK
jgi:hypothetical protein